MTDEAPKKPRARVKAKLKGEAVANVEGAGDIVAALQWIDIAQKDVIGGAAYESHCVVMNGWLCATDGTITAGHRVALDGYFAPNTARLLSALTKAGDGLALVMQDGLLTVKSKGFKCRIPCLAGDTVTIVPPDAPAGPATDKLAEACRLVLPCIKAGADTVLESSAMLTARGTIMATNRRIFVEALHEVQTPVMVIPRHMVALMKGAKGLTAVGGSASTFTAWYGDDRFISTRLYDVTAWPDNPDAIFEGASMSGSPIAKGLLDAVKAVAPHSVSLANNYKHVFIAPREVMSHSRPDQAEAQYDIKTDIPQITGFGADTLAMALSLATTIDWHNGEKAFFYNDGMRGALTTYVSPGVQAGDIPL